MAKEYIERDLLISCCNNDIDHTIDPNVIMRLPTADVAPVVHGRNEYNGNPVDGFCCSECGFYTEDVGRLEYDGDTGDMCLYEYTFNYCPNCGAKMEGGGD